MPDTPAVHHTYNSTAEAETWAQALGVRVYYDARLDLANLANELLWQLNERALLLPDEIRVDAERFRALGWRSIQSPASTNRGRIAINPAADYWRDPIRNVLKTTSPGKVLVVRQPYSPVDS